MGKIGIYGGTFNPVHNGHIYLAKELLKLKAVEKIIVLVAGNPPHKTDSVVSENHRYNMAKSAFSGTDISVSDFELGKSKKNYTLDTMRELKKEFPDDDLYFIIGADSFCDLTLWHKPKELIAENKFIVVDRERFFKGERFLNQKKLLEEEYKIDAVMYNIETPDISSSGLRDLIKNGQDVSKHLPPKVYEYILENKLYR